MATPNSQVTGAQTPDVSQPETVEAQSGVPSGTTAVSTSDATTQAAAQQGSVDKLELDRRRQQAVYDRKLAEAEKQQRELREQLEALKVQGMDEAQRKEYEANKWKAEAERLRAQLEQRDTINQYVSAFTETFGIDASEIDTTDQETIAASGWDAVARRFQALTSQQTPTTPAPATPKNQPRVLTGSGGVPVTKPTQQEVMRAVAEKMGRTTITLDEFYRFAERNPTFMNQWLREE